MRLRINIKGKPYEIEISEEEEKVKIKVGGKEFFFGAPHQKFGGGAIAKTVLPKRDFFKKELRAPITGTISEIFVKEGEFVEKDQKVLILSAMKMENEIVSEFSGKVKEILVKKDREVKEGDILIVLV